ncbi:hypothetical protein Tco_0676876 [Tanacetum coccineum]
MNTTQAQHKAIDDALIAPANRLEFGKCNMRLKTDIKPKEATFQVVLDAFAHSLLPCIPDYYRYLGHTRDITYLTDVNVDYLHQTWREFATVINKCLSGKKTRMDKICLSHSQILWGMFHKKKIDYDVTYFLGRFHTLHIENKDAKKTNKMSYPRFTKIIIDYFMSKDQSISRETRCFGTMLEMTPCLRL